MRTAVPHDPIDIGAGDQFKPAFLAISPNNKVPAMVEPDGPGGEPISVFESGAIPLYLAVETGRFLANDLRGRYEALQWLMFQMASVGPMLGQAHHFRVYGPEKIPYATDRYIDEAKRLYGVMNRRLARSAHIAGPDHGIADMAIFPWLRPWKDQGIAWNHFLHLKGWFGRIDGCPAVQSSAASGCWPSAAKRWSTSSRATLFGADQYKSRRPGCRPPGASARGGGQVQPRAPVQRVDLRIGSEHAMRQLVQQRSQDRPARLDGAEEAAPARITEQQRRKGFDVDVARHFRVVFDVDPREAQRRVSARGSVEQAAELAADAAPFGTQAGHQRRVGVVIGHR